MTTVIKRNKWEIWRDVIFALFAREIRTGFNDKLGLSWAVIQPISFIFILSFIRGRLDGEGDIHGVPTFTFMAIGMIFIQSFLGTLNKTSGAIKKSKPLMAFRQVKPLSAVVAVSMFEILVKIFVVLGICLIMYFLKMEIYIHNLLVFMTLLAALWLLATSLGLMFSLMEMFVPEIKRFREMVTRPLFFISAVFFSLQDFPAEYWYLLDWNPILHAIELARYSAYPSYGLKGVSFEFLAKAVVGALTFSLFLYQSLWRMAISR